ncbi:CRTAC1 family protein [Micromonospora sp. NPDC003776]
MVFAAFTIARLPAASAATRESLAAGFHFTELPIALPPNLPRNTIRQVNPEYRKIQAWISSVGAAVAVNDLEGTGVADDLCLVDSRSDSLIVTPVPGTGGRYTPFVLDPAPLPTSSTMAPMGCAPGDFNGDGRIDLLVYYWGRTPVLFMGRPGAAALSPSAYVPTELIPAAAATSGDGKYHGLLWNTNAVTVADYDGDGHPDIGVFNYFPDSEVLNPAGQPNVQMNHSMSHATNGGGAHILRWTAATTGVAPSASYEEQPRALDPAVATGWTLAASSADLDADLLPELYVANDFGNDHLFYNVSTPGHIRFQLTTGQRGAMTPKSSVLGHDSFKGMGIDFGDLQHNGRFDMFVSNITTSWGLQESNFLWANNAANAAEARAKLSEGTAPFDNKASDMHVAWAGWGWDAKMADFDNSGNLSIVQTTGFINGDIDRWAWLQELAMTNDVLLDNPAMWPKAAAGDDIAGNQPMAFWVKESDGRFVNLSHELGVDVSGPTRGIAVADTTGNGAQDFAVARQWGAPVFYHNTRAAHGDFLGLRLYRPATAAPGQPAPSRGTPAYGAVVRITMADGRVQLAQLDGGGGHSGKRSFDVFFGLGEAAGKPVKAELSWRDTAGSVHKQALDLAPGWHDLMLTTNAQEVA